MAALTKETVLAKARTDSLENVRHLNMWGNDLVDVSLVEKMPNLEVISFSVNKIARLADFAKCPKLQELYLRKNEIADLAEIKHLIGLQHLRVLWLSENPCSLIAPYRQIAIKALPQVTKLDNIDVITEERDASSLVQPPAWLTDCPLTPPSNISPSPTQPRSSSGSIPRTQGTSSSSSSILYAITALLNELDEEQLLIVRAEVESRLTKQQGDRLCAMNG